MPLCWEPYDMTVRVTYVAHDVSRLIDFHDGCTKEIEGIPFEFRFMTYAICSTLLAASMS